MPWRQPIRATADNSEPPGSPPTAPARFALPKPSLRLGVAIPALRWVPSALCRRPAGWRASVRCQPKIHLLLEAVYLSDLHLHFIAQANDSTVAASNQLAALWFKNIKVVFHTRKMD